MVCIFDAMSKMISLKNEIAKRQTKKTKRIAL